MKLRSIQLTSLNKRLLSSTTKSPYNNIPEHIWDLTKRKLYKNPQHPLATLINKTETFFNRP